MLVLSISTDEQHEVQNRGPAPLVPFAADMYTVSPHPEKSL